MSTLPWNLAEFNGPVSSPDAAGAGRAGGCTASELTALREQMQEQNVRAIAEARKAAFEEGRAAGRGPSGRGRCSSMRRCRSDQAPP